MRRYNRTIDGQPIERNPRDYPYSYTRFCIYKDMWLPTDEVVWSDRLQGYDNHDDLFKKHLGTGQYYSSKEPDDIEAFLSDLFGYRIRLTGIEEECNYMTGYPYWLLYFRKED